MQSILDVKPNGVGQVTATRRAGQILLGSTRLLHGYAGFWTLTLRLKLQRYNVNQKVQNKSIHFFLERKIRSQPFVASWHTGIPIQLAGLN